MNPISQKKVVQHPYMNWVVVLFYESLDSTEILFMKYKQYKTFGDKYNF